MNRWLLGQPDRPVPELSRDDFEMEPWEVVRCYPAPEENMFTINRRMARALQQARNPKPSREQLRSAVRSALGLAQAAPDTPAAITGGPFYAWLHWCQEVVLRPEAGIELPGTFLYPIKPEDRSLTILYLDDRGRWEALRTAGLLSRMARFIQRESPRLRAVFTVDLRGWGDSRPTPTPFDIAGWSGNGRPLAYLSNAMGEGLFAMRVRDALAALAYLRSRAEVDPAEIVVAGHGMGAVVALHVAALEDPLRGVIADSPLARFQELAESESYTWPPDAFVPEVLKHYDLPELLAGLSPLPTLVANPLDAVCQPISETGSLFGQAQAANPQLAVRTLLDAAASARLQLDWLDGLQPKSATR
jgi:pimeloyl-ACP methyl ester carboxylesterase